MSQSWGIVVKDSDLARRRPGFVEITCTDLAAFRAWSATDQFQTIDMLTVAKARVTAGTMAATALDDLEKITGFNSNPDGLLASRLLRETSGNLVDTVRYDWVHNLMQGGIFVIECESLLAASKPFGVTRAMLQAFLGDAAWEFPKFAATKSKQLHRIFDERRVSTDDPAR